MSDFERKKERKSGRKKERKKGGKKERRKKEFVDREQQRKGEGSGVDSMDPNGPARGGKLECRKRRNRCRETNVRNYKNE